MIFEDETGFAMAPVSHSTWGLRGQTPRITHATTRIRYSALGAIAAGGKGKRPRFYFRIYPHNIRSEQVIKFIDHLLFMIPGHIVLVWDNLPTHRAKAVKEFAANYPRLHIEKLPPYQAVYKLPFYYGILILSGKITLSQE